MNSEIIENMVTMLRRMDALQEREGALREDLKSVDRQLDALHSELAHAMNVTGDAPRSVLRERAITQIGRYAVKHAKVTT